LNNEYRDGMKRLTLPLSADDARALAAGDQVLFDGLAVVTVGFTTHQRMMACIEKGAELPIDLGGTFFHMGSCCRERDGRWLPDYVNPTTSTRFNAFMPTIIRKFGLTAVAGKGGLDETCVAVLKEVGCVYFSMAGGASPLLTAGVEERLETGWDDLIEQFRLTRLRLKGFGPLTVAIDANGNSIYRSLRDSAAARMPTILQELNDARSQSMAARANDKAL